MGAAVRVVGAAVRDNPSRTMPRRTPRPGALQAAQRFARLVIAEAETDDWILPKNGTSVPEVHASADAQAAAPSVSAVSSAAVLRKLC